ncbi:MAG: hypothetical protein M3R61_00230 [Chloroflexota bacterium]|nr:hypothetical protein [Chloroflexota bacterium]
MRAFPLLCLLCALIAPAHAAPLLRLEASTVRSEFTASDTFTITAYLFNDGDTDTSGVITISAPLGLVACSPDTIAGDIAPDRALQLNACYRVAADAPPGLARFVVRGGGLTRAVIVRVGPVVAPFVAPPPIYRVYVPAFL